MYPFMNEDAAWQRLQDLQREMENSRLLAEARPWAALQTLGRLVARVWLLAGMAAQRPPRRRLVLVERDDERGSEVA